MAESGKRFPALPVTTPGDAIERHAEIRARRALQTPGSLVPFARSDPTWADAQQLSPSVRSYFEPRFGADFSGVRVRTDGEAARLAESLNARAFTLGRDIVFNSGQYDPGSEAGNRLLAHELAHTLQPGSERRIARDCTDALNAIAVPESDSAATANVFLDLGTFEITPSISVSPLAGNFRVLIRLPGALQEVLFPSFLGINTMRIRADISGLISTSGNPQQAAQFANNQICLYITFRPGEGAGEWFADLRILSGTQFVAPLRLGGLAGTSTTAPVPTPATSGTARVRIDLTEDLTASAGPLRIESANDFSANWSSIMAQVKNALAIPIRNIEIPVNLRTRASVTVPVPLPSSEGNEGGIVPVEVLGGINLSTRLSSSGENFQLDLVGGGEGTAFMGLIGLRLSGRGRLSGPLPSTIRLGDLSEDFLRDLIRRSEGGGEINGILTVAGLPGRLRADFSIREGNLFGDASFVSPYAIGGGTYRYGLSEGLSARLGMLGFVNLTLDPAEERFQEQLRTHTGPQPWDLGGSVTGLGLTGISLSPDLTHILSIGAGPQFVTEPTGEKHTGFYGGAQYRLSF